MANIRPYRPADGDDLYAIALATGASGADASSLYDDPKLVGHVYAAPYGALYPETAFVVEDAAGVAGYIVGAADTRAFEALAEARWWPSLRRRYADPPGEHARWSADQTLAWVIHHPPRAPTALVNGYPSHLHINLLPRLQGQGLGRRLIDRWLAAIRAQGSCGAHLGVGAGNTRAVRFYRAYGLIEPVLPRPPPPGLIWFAMKLPGETAPRPIRSAPHRPGR